ncbi:hypothetical protein NE172_15240 [Clostridium botulinum]|uniref:Uncharacterized protein n=1 Tax=Clostridium botulinum TaxID=1491 RepID=A0A6B4JKA8_CLOBO|nr:hypothetical protein [Clostridium botulinum]EES48727.1 phage protein, putative [Clostridium botulinum E1 str. 'BoNT E Beluga']MBY6760076.1 hypothetical protein [Clostridium botulinum]MBY6918985.1 hypothetical protein [Clostridium botulinum]MBY6988611.1 hypothetical protein [Clostridium botulinum]MCR1132292.1 hypothetical protein [Clostridium botulinum]
MYLHKTIIDNQGVIIEKCVLFIDNKSHEFEITEDMKIVDRYTLDNELIKPKWDFDNKKWIESATEEEIQEWEELNKLNPKEPNEVEQLQKQLLETQNMVLELQYKLTNKDLDIK